MAPATAQQGLSKAPTAPAPFTVRSDSGRWWLVTPAGRPFFSSGVCCVTSGETWLEYDLKKPAYAAWRQHPSPIDWADATLTRLKSWGFTTIGGWSDDAMLKRSPKMDMPYTLVLHLGSSSGAPWFDMWDPKVIAAMEEAARKQILPVRNDPRLLGYYTDNEMGWWNGPLFQMTLAQSPHSEQRKRLVRMLRQHYQNDWTRLRKDFVPKGAASFDALDRRGTLTLQPGGQGMAQIRRFAGKAAERYYALVRQIVRKFDRRGLLLGDRYQSFYYPEVARASRPYVDIVSTNLNPGWKDGTSPRFFLDTLYALAGRPVMIGEFYMTATENRSGNKNNASGFPVVATQQERAAGFARTLTDLAKTPYVVGADWFQYSDEPTFGRSDGENYNMGLVDIDDRPYVPITVAASALDRNALHAAAGTSRPDIRGGVPPAPKDPLAHWKPMEALGDWDRERGFVPSHSRYPMGDLYLCWDRDALYVGLYSTDIVESSCYKDKRLPEVDRAEWTLHPGDAQRPIRVRLGAGRPPIAHGATVEVVDTSGAEHGVYHVAAIRLPAALFGKRSLAAGDTIRLEASYRTHARADNVAWAGSFTLVP
jgi:hypothetical protein